MKAQILTLIVLAACYCSASDLVCPEQFDPQNPTFLPHADCTKYYVCNWLTPLERSCPEGLHWNPQANYCDYPVQAGCVAGPVVTSTTPAVPTTAKPVERCPEEFNPDHQPNYLPHEDCTKYYICSWGGAAIEQDCPAGLHWSQVNRYCDYPGQVECSAAVSPSTAAPAASSTTPSADCPEVYDQSHQVYFPHVDCTKYYICTYEGAKLEQNCPPGLHWSEVNNYCDHPDRAQCKVAAGGSTQAPTTSSEEVTSEVTTQHPSVECPFGDDQGVPVFLPHESDCTKYYVCDNGRPVQLTCPAGLFWNAIETTCDNPQQSGCVQRLLLRLW
ncbi:probable chitinase 10 [Culex quinquefasciatus]|uniref:probable chitinase 10 n=1 Tax=Culex quinquefasciatus TaxID=7176 RepID=UPI0018E2CDB9|nr:probable chitinase 10 [Culex quinquefasciatus]